MEPVFGLITGDERPLAVGTLLFVTGPARLALPTPQPPSKPPARRAEGRYHTTEEGYFSFLTSLWRGTESRHTRPRPSDPPDA